MRQRIVIVNPNSNSNMTALINRRLDSLRNANGPDIVCLTLEQGPLAIETDEHCRQVVAPLCNLVASDTAAAAAAIVIGCFSDPGLAELRAIASRPVFGFCEAAVATALGLGGCYGILTNLESDIADEIAYLRAGQLDQRLAGIEAIGVPVSRLGEQPDVLESMVGAVERLEARGAGSVILGCAGFSAFASELGRRTGVRIIDPAIASVGMAITALAF